MYRTKLREILPVSARHSTICVKEPQIKLTPNSHNKILGRCSLDMKSSYLNIRVISQRLYHCKTSVYGYNAILHQKRKDQNADPKEYGYEKTPHQRAAQPN